MNPEMIARVQAAFVCLRCGKVGGQFNDCDDPIHVLMTEERVKRSLAEKGLATWDDFARWTRGLKMFVHPKTGQTLYYPWEVERFFNELSTGQVAEPK